ncbi:MAG: methyltransferase domain-containing protein [Thermodesulfovibrionales bacterium]|jgi:SAM-dependent methyltransferase
MRRRKGYQKIKDFLTFPLRAVTLFYADRWGLSSLASERYDFVSREVIGQCLDVGCGRNNRFIREYLGGNGRGIDVYPYEGLTEENLVKDISHFPFSDEIFDSVTFIANLNHVPQSLRDCELAEAYRVLRKGGNIIITMGNPIAEILAHRAIELHDRIFRTRHDVDAERGMEEEEDYYLTDREILERLKKARFQDINKRYFWSQWGLNHLFVGWKF